VIPKISAPRPGLATHPDVIEAYRNQLEKAQESLEDAYHVCRRAGERLLAILEHDAAQGLPSGYIGVLRDFMDRLDRCEETYEPQSLKAADSPSRTD
jgi:hypothetical protein